MKKTRGTAQWAYRCSPAGADLAGTTQLLNVSGFLWRSLHNVDGHKIANVGNVEVGDTVHVYYVAEGTESYLASYLIEAPLEPADPEVVAIDAVRDGPLFDQLTEAGYAVDPELDYFTGFRVRKDDYATKPDGRPRWVAKNAIARIARPDAVA